MGLSDAEKERRRTDEHVEYIRKHVCNKEGDKPYVFVSYKSDDWEIVLQDIVYRLVKDYHLNIYFDGDFDVHNSHWTTQFPENMADPKCKGILTFLDDSYATSYATLLELMYSQCSCFEKMTDKETQKEKLVHIKKQVVPVNIGKLSIIINDEDTGLGKDSYHDGERWITNPKAVTEKTLFDKTFKRGEKLGVLATFKLLYKYEGLSKETCSEIVNELLSGIDYNDNEYFQKGASLDSIVNSIKSACGSEVFGESKQSDDNNEDFQSIQEETEDKIGEPAVSQTVDIEPVPPVVEIVPAPSSANLWVYRAKGAVSYLEWDGESKNCIVKKGSRTAAEANKFVKLVSAKNMKDKLLQDGVLVEDEFVVDYAYDKISTMINVLAGGAVSMPKAMKDGVLRRCDGMDETSLPKDKNEDVFEGKSDGFEYRLWSGTYTAGKLAGMMHDVFDLVAEKYPEKIIEIAHNDSITAVALKQDVDAGNLPQSKLNYFKAKKEHEVNGSIYYVSTHYNREQGIGQLEKILSFCEGSADAFEILSAPDKTGHISNKKKGLSELL